MTSIMKPAENTKLPRGRKRSPEAEKAVLDATYDLLLREGLQATTVEAIAARAKVSKATIYKWWPNRASVIMSAFLREARYALPYPEELEPKNIFDRLHTMAMEFHGAIGSMICALIAEGQSDPEIAQAFREGYVFARRQQGVELVKRAIAKKLIAKLIPTLFSICSMRRSIIGCSSDISRSRKPSSVNMSRWHSAASYLRRMLCHRRSDRGNLAKNKSDVTASVNWKMREAI